MMGSQPIKRFSFLSFFLCEAKYKSFAIFTFAPPRWGTSHTHHVAILKHIKWHLHKAPQGVVGGRSGRRVAVCSCGPFAFSSFVNWFDLCSFLSPTFPAHTLHSARLATPALTPHPIAFNPALQQQREERRRRWRRIQIPSQGLNKLCRMARWQKEHQKKKKERSCSTEETLATGIFFGSTVSDVGLRPAYPVKGLGYEKVVESDKMSF